MEIDLQLLMARKTEKGLMVYLTQPELYTEAAIQAAVAELKKRGKVFTEQEEEELEANLKQKRDSNFKGGVVEDDPFKNFSITQKNILWLTAIFVPLFAIITLFPTHGGGGSEIDAVFRVVIYTSVSIFTVSGFSIVWNLVQKKFFFTPVIFFLISLPVTLGVGNQYYRAWRMNRNPDLTAHYEIPVSMDQYRLDSAFASKIVVDETIDSNARGGSQIISCRIDTLIYSEDGDRIFVIYGKQFEKRDAFRYDWYADYLIADERDSTGWIFYTPSITYSEYSNSWDELKIATRKIFFNQFEFGDKYKGTDEYFWDQMTKP